MTVGTGETMGIANKTMAAWCLQRASSIWASTINIETAGDTHPSKHRPCFDLPERHCR
jgi:hypothetical protein